MLDAVFIGKRAPQLCSSKKLTYIYNLFCKPYLEVLYFMRWYFLSLFILHVTTIYAWLPFMNNENIFNEYPKKQYKDATILSDKMTRAHNAMYQTHTCFTNLIHKAYRQSLAIYKPNRSVAIFLPNQTW